MRSSPAPGTWTSFSRFAAADISRVKASVTSTSTSVRRLQEMDEGLIDHCPG
jgi:hypothetical protein